MTADSHGITAVQKDQSKQMRLALAAMLIPIFFVIGFATCIIGTYHKPDPSNIKLDVVGPAAQTAPLRSGLEKAAGAAFDIRSVATVGQAEHDVRQLDVNAAYVPTPNAGRPATVIVASANGRLVATAAETLARSAASAQGERLAIQEVRPLASGDELGLGVFMFAIVCTICGYLAVSLLGTAAPRLRPSRVYPLIAANAVLVSVIAYLIGGLGFGVYTGSFGAVIAFVGVGALYTLVVGLVTRWFQVLLGPPALFLSLTIFVFLNIPSLGATYTAPVLPSFWRFLNHFWIGASTVDTERSILYLNGLGLGTDILKLLAWTGVAAVLLAVPAYRKVARTTGSTSVPDSPARMRARSWSPRTDSGSSPTGG